MTPNLSRWSRMYRLPLALTGTFLVLLAILALSAGPAPSPDRETRPTPRAAGAGPRASVCPVCGVGRACDKSTGQCRLSQPPTPTACVKGTRYDQEAGYCVPESGSVRSGAKLPGKTTPRPATPAPAATPKPSFTPAPEPLRTPRGAEPAAPSN